MPIKKIKNDEIDSYLSPTYGTRAFNKPIPKYALPETSLSPRAAYDLIHDELMLDGNARLNLATFSKRSKRWLSSLNQAAAFSVS